jgi:putative transposase
MARQARVVVPGRPHHVYLRGNNRRRLFSNDGDRLFWLRCLQKGLEASGCVLHQLTLMTNHIHLIVTPPDEGALGVLVKRACQRYAQKRNERMNASGKLFEQRYRSKVIEDERQLLYTTLYNDANGFRGGIVEDPTAHRWSTAPLHAGRRGTRGSKIPRSMWTPSSWYQRLGRSDRERSKNYTSLMGAYLREEIERPPQFVDEELDDETDDERYRQRIARPDGSSAREAATQWGRKRS